MKNPMRDMRDRPILNNECVVKIGNRMIEISAVTGEIIITAGDAGLRLSELKLPGALKTDYAGQRIYRLEIEDS